MMRMLTLTPFDRPSRINVAVALLTAVTCLCPPAAQAAEIEKILFLGNSITLHPPKPDIGWYGNWGMAASQAGSDYVHRVVGALSTGVGTPDTLVKNIAAFEREFATYDTAALVNEAIAFNPDAIVLAIGENVPSLANPADKTVFMKRTAELIDAIRAGRSRLIVVRSCFWADTVKDQALETVCQRVGGVFANIGTLHDDEANYARSEREYSDAGVGAHPGDRGMQAIADAIVSSILEGQSRQSGLLPVAHYLIDDTSFATRNTYDLSMVQSGWNFDNRGGPQKLTDAGPYELNDISNAFGTRLVRTINAQTGGKMTLESKFNLSSGSDGFYYEFQSTNGATAYRLFTDNGCFNVSNGGTTAPLDLAAATGTYSVKVILDLTTATAQTVINNVSFGTHDFASPVSDIKRLILGTTAEDVLRVVPSPVTLTADYAVHERFTQVNTGSLPYDWENTVSDRYGYYLTATAINNMPIIQMKKGHLGRICG